MSHGSRSIARMVRSPRGGDRLVRSCNPIPMHIRSRSLARGSRSHARGSRPPRTIDRGHSYVGSRLLPRGDRFLRARDRLERRRDPYPSSVGPDPYERTAPSITAPLPGTSPDASISCVQESTSFARGNPIACTMIPIPSYERSRSPARRTEVEHANRSNCRPEGSPPIGRETRSTGGAPHTPSWPHDGYDPPVPRSPAIRKRGPSLAGTRSHARSTAIEGTTGATPTSTAPGFVGPSSTGLRPRHVFPSVLTACLPAAGRKKPVAAPRIPPRGRRRSPRSGG